LHACVFHEKFGPDGLSSPARRSNVKDERGAGRQHFRRTPGPSIHRTIFGGIMLGIALGLGSAAVGIGLGLLGAGAGILLSDKTVKTARRELTA